MTKTYPNKRPPIEAIVTATTYGGGRSNFNCVQFFLDLCNCEGAGICELVCVKLIVGARVIVAILSRLTSCTVFIL